MLRINVQHDWNTGPTELATAMTSAARQRLRSGSQSFIPYASTQAKGKPTRMRNDRANATCSTIDSEGATLQANARNGASSGSSKTGVINLLIYPPPEVHGSRTNRPPHTPFGPVSCSRTRTTLGHWPSRVVAEMPFRAADRNHTQAVVSLRCSHLSHVGSKTLTGATLTP